MMVLMFDALSWEDTNERAGVLARPSPLFLLSLPVLQRQPLGGIAPALIQKVLGFITLRNFLSELSDIETH